MKFRDLTKQQRKAVSKSMRRGIRLVSFGAMGYDVVDSPDEMLRRRGGIEVAGEDAALPWYNRAKMINLARRGMRNGDAMRALVRQLELNVVGTVGGKATFAFPAGYESVAARMRHEFARWTRSAEFADGLPFAKVLSLAVDAKFLGGDIVLVFDDDLIEDSGKLIAFEADEIADIPAEWFAQKFGDGWVQRQGRIYNPNGRFMGVMVSHKYRGVPTFPHDEDGVLFLTKPKFGLPDWVMVRDVWRFNQGRGVPPVAAPLDSLLDLESVTKSETQAAWKNAQTLGQILQEKEDVDEDALPDDYTPGASVDGEEEASDGDCGAANGGGAVDEAEDFELDNIRSAGAIFDMMPEGVKMELLDTKRPNPNVEGFVKWLSSRAGAAVGLAKCYANLEATQSYTAFRGEQVMTWPTFEEWQKDLERSVCDWCLEKWVGWASKQGIIDAAELPANWNEYVSWSWPTMREVDAKAAAEAKKLMLENGLITLSELHPGDPDGYMAEIKKDVERYHAIGLVHPMERSVSGGVITAADSEAEQNKIANKETQGDEANGEEE